MRTILICGVLAVCAPWAVASELILFSDPSGLSAEAEFTLVNPTTLQVRVRNTSTGVPAGFSNSDQLLTVVSWDFDPPGAAANTTITGGTVAIGPTSASANFSTGSYGPGADVSGEYGAGNTAISGALANFLSANTAGATQFPGANRDGPVGLDGPQGGLVANPAPVALGGLGAIQNEIIATLTLSNPINDLSFLHENDVRVEFGSDAAFITSPEPGALALWALGMVAMIRRGARR